MGSYYDQLLFPSDNELGIPTLLEDMQAEFFAKPCYAWGSIKRTRLGVGTWQFYTDDYRWNGLLKKPWNCSDTSPYACTELNITLFEDTPAALAVAEIYKKRWVARYWQSQGVRIFVDVFVPHVHRDYSLLGVPVGWKSYSTRGSDKNIDLLPMDFDIAATHAKTKNIIFVVFGGGSRTADWCTQNNCIHLPYNTKKNPYSTGE